MADDVGLLAGEGQRGRNCRTPVHSSRKRESSSFSSVLGWYWSRFRGDERSVRYLAAPVLLTSASPAGAVALDGVHHLAVLAVLAAHVHRDQRVRRRQQEQHREEPPEDQDEHDQGDVQ